MVTSYRGKYVVNEKGTRVSVILDVKAYRKMLEEIEELESIRAYDAARASGGEVVPFERAVREIEKSRR